MAERKTAEQKLAELEKKMEQLQVQKKEIAAKVSKEKRAQRTRRLIQNGALAEQYLHATDMPNEDFEKLLSRLVQIEEVKTILPVSTQQSLKKITQEEK